MTFPVVAARRRGFTLIELLIVIVVIAILALIVIPRVMGASRKAKESSLRGNLQELRNGLEQFQADCWLLSEQSDRPRCRGASNHSHPDYRVGWHGRHRCRHPYRQLQGPLSDCSGRH